MKIYRFCAVILVALVWGAELPALAGWTPLRAVITDKTDYKWRDICEVKPAKTYGLDLGLWQSGTCTTIGLQLAPAASVQNMYGVQFGLLIAKNETGYGLQLGGLFNDTRDSDNKSYLIQIAGLVNNPMFMYPPSINGAQIAPVGNAAGLLNGMQAGLVNMLAAGRALQAGLVNIQIDPGENISRQFIMQLGGYNTRDNLNGFQVGIVNRLGDAKEEVAQSKSAQVGLYNYAYNIKGFQLGVVNRAAKLAGVQLGLINIVSTQKHLLGIPFCPVLNVAW